MTHVLQIFPFCGGSEKWVKILVLLFVTRHSMLKIKDGGWRWVAYRNLVLPPGPFGIWDLLRLGLGWDFNFFSIV